MPLCDYVFVYQGYELPLSAPEQGSACEHHGGHYSFGVPTTELALANAVTGATGHLFTFPEHEHVATFHVEHFDPELSLLSGDVQPVAKSDAHQGHGFFNFLERLVRRTGIWEPGNRIPRPIRH
jgi:hypothetical protein